VLRRTLHEKIKIANDHAWSNLVEAVESDPWRRPYRTVTRELRTKGALATREMETALLTKVIETLFPPQEDTAVEQPHDTARTERSTEWEVTEKEPWEANRRMASRDVGGSNGDHGSQTSVPLHQMPEVSLLMSVANGEAGPAL
jgi:hypothetical protein